MLKHLSVATAVAIAFTSLIPRLALSQTPLTNRYPVAASSDVDMLPCYMQTSDGSILNLASICPKLASKSATAQTPAPDPKVTVSNLNYDGHSLKGLLTNQTDQAVTGVTVNYQLVDSQGNQVDAGSVESRSLSLTPGASIPFSKGSNHPGATVKVTSVDWQY